MYSLIIGLSPSKGARSPILWNKAYKAYNIKCRMKACDIETDEKLATLLEELIKDKEFRGGSITFPYKEKVAKILKDYLIDESTSKLATVNALYRNDSDELIGANTDGMAALSCIETLYFSNQRIPDNILVLGLGGVGKAVSAFLHDNLLKSYSNLRIFSASRNIDVAFLSRFSNLKYVHWVDRHNYIDSKTLIINCTSLGDYEHINLSPIDLDLISENKLPIGVYDVIYNPLETKLISWSKSKGIMYSNGLKMNLYQAAIAFKFSANLDKDLDEIRNVMSS